MNDLGSGCCSVGGAVASNSRGRQFESSHRQIYVLNIYCQLYWKDENKEKEADNGQFFEKFFLNDICSWIFSFILLKILEEHLGITKQQRTLAEGDILLHWYGVIPGFLRQAKAHSD